ncbi:hypothetical protein [Arsenophonus nasoniae]|uniref:Uncharacterized protein n=1 Tax=Arsenophonus nasoniae TaxID=638 RepID=A0AA95GU31_9GAMM|nr:hypothetical protein [Arsenophonus nasoniae]WGM04031.1 hypothetical protein QE210_21590 [Arsenophonus nasoniae]
MAINEIYNVHVDFTQPKGFVFNRRKLRRYFHEVGEKHTQLSRNLITHRGGRSKAGEYPHWQTGRLAHSIGHFTPKATTKRPGLLVKIAPNQKRGKGVKPIVGDFYPQFLNYGAKRGGKTVLAPRKNYIYQAMRRLESWTQRTLVSGLKASLEIKRIND